MATHKNLLGAHRDEGLIVREGPPMVAHQGLVARTCHGDWLGAQTNPAPPTPTPQPHAGIRATGLGIWD